MEEIKPEETSIIKKPNEELGKAIVSEAEEEYQAKLKQAVINRVVRYKVVIGNLKKLIKKIKECQDFNSSKIHALGEGDFEFDSETGEIDFHNKDLNVSWERVNDL